MNVRRPTRGKGRIAVAAATVATALVAATAAYAVLVDDVELTGGGGTTWDPYADIYACTDAELTPDGFTPVSDGSTDSPSRSDAFDDSFVLWVGGFQGSIFRDLDGEGAQQGQSLRVGPTRTGGLRVSAVERALQSSPTLQMLYTFKNSSRRAKTRKIVLEDSLGSDDATTVATSSSGDKKWRPADRWLVTYEDPFDSVADPVVTQVWYGKGALARVLETRHTDGGEPDCFASTFRIRVPGRSARSLLFFGEMNADSIGDAKQKAKKFNSRDLNAKLLKGISPKVQKRILNWDL
jgi:hypothetical protein